MRWIATPEKDTATVTLEKRLWDAADQFRANSGLKAQEYSGPILGLIFLNGLFASAELALVSARQSRLRGLAEQGHRGARAALQLRQQRHSRAPGKFYRSVAVAAGRQAVRHSA